MRPAHGVDLVGIPVSRGRSRTQRCESDTGRRSGAGSEAGTAAAAGCPAAAAAAPPLPAGLLAVRPGAGTALLSHVSSSAPACCDASAAVALSFAMEPPPDACCGGGRCEPGSGREVPTAARLTRSCDKSAPACLRGRGRVTGVVT